MTKEKSKQLRELFDILEKTVVDYIKEHPGLIDDIESDFIDFSFGFDNVREVVKGDPGGSDIYCGFIVDKYLNDYSHMII